MQQILNDNLTKAREVYDSLKHLLHVPAECVEILTQKGVSTKSGKPWNEHIIRAVLRGDYYDENVLIAVLEVGEQYVAKRQAAQIDISERSTKILEAIQA